MTLALRRMLLGAGVGALLLVLCGAAAASAATFTVNSQADTLDPGGCATSATCSLRDAVITADAATTPSTITLPPGTYPITIPSTGPGDPASGDLDITATSPVTISGAGAGTTAIDLSAAPSRAFSIAAGATLTLTGITVRAASPAAASTDTPDGGAIESAGNLTLVGDGFSSDSSPGGAGGAVRQTGSGALTALYTVFTRNQAGTNGGAIADDSTGPLVLDGDVFGTSGTSSAQNDARGAGGAVYDAASSSARIVATGFYGNQAGILTQGGPPTPQTTGGALSLAGSSYELDGDELDGNLASGGGGGIALNHGVLTGRGDALIGNSAGAIVSSSAQPLALTNTTFSGNRGVDGGAIDFSVPEPVQLVNDTFWNNTATTAGNAIYGAQGLSVAGDGVQNTVFGADASAPASGPTCAGAAGAAAFPAGVDLGHNLASDGSCLSSATGDRVDPGLILGPPAANGGTVLTDAEAPGAATVDSGAPAACPAVDARGVSRPQGASCDIGAYELAASPVPAPPAGLRPTASTSGVLGVTTDTAYLGATVDPHGLSTTFAFEIGPTTAYGQTTVSSHVTSGPVTVETRVTGLKPDTLYHYRVLAGNVAGLVVGADRTFRTAIAYDGVLSPAGSRLTVTRGRVSIPLTCSGAAPCRVRLGLTASVRVPGSPRPGTLVVTRASGITVTVPARRRITISEPLAPAALSSLEQAAGHRLAARLTLRPLTVASARSTAVTLVLS